MASGIDDEVTLRANREGFLRFQLRPRRLVDVSEVDMSTDILGVRYASPIIVAPRPAAARDKKRRRGRHRQSRMDGGSTRGFILDRRGPLTINAFAEDMVMDRTTGRRSRHRGAAANPGPLIRRALLDIRVVKSSNLERNVLRIGDVFAL
jgi:hypothetical protein